MGVEELKGSDVAVTVTKMGPPGSVGEGSFSANVSLNGQKVAISGTFSVCRLPDRSGP
jgi:hypothetical protein